MGKILHMSFPTPSPPLGDRLELEDADGNFYVYTDVGHKRDGVWTATGASWQKGVCITQFNRSCPAGKPQASDERQHGAGRERPRERGA